jgi:hypothetical protein
MPSTGTSTGSADVIGNVRRTGFTAGGQALSFGNPFNRIAFAAGSSTPSDVTLNLVKSAPAGLPDAVQRTYAISQTGGGAFSATLRLHYLDGELNGNQESTLKLFRLEGPWIEQGSSARSTADNWVEKSGVTQFSSWALKRSASPPTSHAPFDFDGDGKTDIGIFRPSGGEWWVNRSGDGQTLALVFGSSTDVIVPADYTGDGKADIAVFRPSSGEWYVLRSDDFSYFALPFGTNGDVPVPADYDADGKADFAVFRPSSSTWFITQSSGAPTRIVPFGSTGDQPVVSDYDGDGKADIAIIRPAASGAEWWIARSTTGPLVMQFGESTDKAVQGDYTGDGKADIAIWRPSTGEWFVVRSDDFSYYAFPFGTTGDVVAPGDYDGDGKFDVTVFRPSTATWYIARTTAGTQIVPFGANGDRPLPNAFVP